jgi:transcriptional antiterminator NusG
MNALATIPGVIRFLSDRHGKPEPLSQEEVNRILGVGDENGPSDGSVVIDPYVKGDTVRIKAGPFKDFDGNVEDVQTEKCKLKVMVSVFGRSTPVELGFDQVERLS